MVSSLLGLSVGELGGLELNRLMRKVIQPQPGHVLGKYLQKIFYCLLYACLLLNEFFDVEKTNAEEEESNCGGVEPVAKTHCQRLRHLLSCKLYSRQYLLVNIYASVDIYLSVYP